MIRHALTGSWPALILGCLTLLPGHGFLPGHASAEDDVGEAAAAPADGPAEVVEARERELKAEEDPLQKEKAEAVVRDEVAVERGDLQVYGSVRIRYREVDSQSIWSDGGSRAGLAGGWRLNPGLRVFGRGEFGFNVLDQIDFLFNRGDRPQGRKIGDSVFVRLLYAGVETPSLVLTAGKNWSTYYRVASFTDRFQGAGASASGTYNAATDGGYTGTGRADGVLQARLSVDTSRRERLFKPLGLNLQIQHGEPIPQVPGKYYRTTLGASSVYEAANGMAVGLAYNHAAIDEGDLVSLQQKGLDGDATALLVGARWYGERWYAGAVVSRLQNHETTDRGVYFDGSGWELYSQYRVAGPWWAIAGWNKLKPDADQVQAGAFGIDYGIVGVRYSFDDFRRMIFANVRFESSSTQAGRIRSDIYTIGVRWDLP